MKWIIVPILVALLLILVVSNIVIVQQSRAYVVERLGAFRTVWNVGLHLKVPFIERVAKKVSLKEQVADFAPQPVITKDNVTMQIDTVIYFQITDPKLYTYGVEHPMNAIENLTATTLRNIIGDMELDQSLTSRDTINSRMRSILDEATAFTDPENEDKLQRSIAALTKGKTLLVIAHRLSTIKNADNIVVLKNGAIEAAGTQEELFVSCPLYKDMWLAHIGAQNWAVSAAEKEA